MQLGRWEVEEEDVKDEVATIHRHLEARDTIGHEERVRPGTLEDRQGRSRGHGGASGRSTSAFGESV